MKWFFHIFLMRIKVTSKMPLLWLLLILSAFFAVVPVNAYLTQKQDAIPLAIVNQDEGIFPDQFIEEINEFTGLTFDIEESLEIAQRKLNTGAYDGVVVITEDFTSNIKAGEFANMLNIYISPSSSVTPLISEVLAEKVLEIWAQEYIVQDFQKLKSSAGQPLSEAEMDALRAEMNQVVGSKEILSLEINAAPPDLASGVPETGRSAEDALRDSVLYYASMTIIFIFIGGRWVIDQRHNSIGLRMQSLGITPAISVLASSTGMAVFCSGVLTLSVFIFSIFLKVSFWFSLSIIAMSFLYFLATIGLALIFTFFTKESISLLLISPIAVLINSLLGGMFYPLPDWAVFWRRISFFLPGRMLKSALFSAQYWPLVIGAVIYIFIGVFTASRKINPKWTNG